ncbi:MAG: Z1 domain-containing protein, partial [Prevotella sp.]|nr:Z1 domain-containing protein [Prevotella sp.]
MAEQVIIKKRVSFTSEAVVELQNVSCGDHIQEFLEYQREKSGLDDEGISNLRNSSCDILTYCNPHDAVTNVPTTHLVVGYVQSGKTMSFTSLIELAADNRYKVVIVIAGITTSLLKQTHDRLGKDLTCGNDKNYRYFKLPKNPDATDALEIARNLKMKNTILVITVLKHSGRINNVKDIFLNDEVKKLLTNETVLIIDDEADQASLNNFGRINSKTGDDDALKMSSTYEAILELRNALPGNSYVQYTATPQANILINTMDMLSPKTHTVLKPGRGYCGGKLFFGIGAEGKRFGDGLIKVISDNEVFNSKRNPLVEIPRSLKSALMLHIWAVIINTRVLENVSQLSMMVHTDVTLKWNAQFYEWINETLNNWSNLIDESGFSVKRFLLEEEFKNTFKEAVKFYTSEHFDYQQLKEYIPEVLCDTHVYLIT